MQFPSFVPAAVKKKITRYLDGDSDRGIPGYFGLLDKAENALLKVEDAIEARTRRGEVEYLPSLRIQKVEAAKHRDMLAGDVKCLQRLASDSRMKQAFEILSEELSDDKEWGAFIFSAWVAAGVNFGHYRERNQRAGELKEEIANAADKLKLLIQQFASTGAEGPGEFFFIPELLRKTDNHELQGHNLHMWRSMRRYIVGDPEERDVPQFDPQSPPQIIRIVVAPNDGESSPKRIIDPEEEHRHTVRYAWGTAPEFSELLSTLANAARNFTPSESGMVGAAISSRQQSTKTQYLRAFADRLTDSGLTISATIKRAMAIVASVAIAAPDVDVTSDDVRKALGRPKAKKARKTRRK